MTPITCSRQSLPHSMRRGGSICRLLVCSVSQGRPEPPVERPATLQRGFLRPDSRACRNDLPGARRDQDHRGKVAMPREYRAPAWIARLQASGSGSLHPRVSSADSSTTWASNAVRAGNTTSIAPTIKMGPSSGTDGQGSRASIRVPQTGSHAPASRQGEADPCAAYTSTTSPWTAMARAGGATSITAGPYAGMPALRHRSMAGRGAPDRPPRAWKAFSHGFPCRYRSAQAAPRSPPRDPCGAACRCDG